MRPPDRFTPALLLCCVVWLGLAPGCREEEPEEEAGPEVDPVPSEAIDLACALLASCGPLGGEQASECATAALTRPASGPRFTPEWLACLGAAGSDCAAVAACSGPGENPCEDVGQGAFCDGAVVISCFGSAVEFTTDCAAWGLTCAEHGEEAECQGGGPSCLPGAERCEGDDAILCLGHREATFTCPDLVEGRRCVLNGERAECVPPQAECSPVESPGECREDELRFCSAAGATTGLSCTDLGFASCALDATSRAVCQN